MPASEGAVVSCNYGSTVVSYPVYRRSGICVCRSSTDRHIKSVIQLLWWWLVVYEEGGDVSKPFLRVCNTHYQNSSLLTQRHPKACSKSTEVVLTLERDGEQLRFLAASAKRRGAQQLEAAQGGARPTQDSRPARRVRGPQLSARDSQPAAHKLVVGRGCRSHRRYICGWCAW